VAYSFYVFFSSRRRHTRFSRDWSSDVCSSDLEPKYGYEQALFPIVQGSTYKDLRAQSAEYIANAGAFGNAIGGLSVGEPAEEMYEMCEEIGRASCRERV